MLVYKNTFDNIKTINCDFPIEDQFYTSLNEAIVADGITRDPVGIYDLSTCNEKEFLVKYPRPSGATLAAKEICDTFKKTKGSLVERLEECNKNVKRLNDKCIIKCDYLQNDYYGAVVSCINITNDILNYAYICDCGIIVYDNKGNIKFQTSDDKALYSDPYINKIGIPWDLPEARIMVRKNYRNNLNNIQDNKCVSYGALTGEDSAIKFIKQGKIKLSNKDIVLVYSDGFKHFLHDSKFISLLINFKKEDFENYVNYKSLSDYHKYGKEKTIILFKV